MPDVLSADGGIPSQQVGYEDSLHDTAQEDQPEQVISCPRTCFRTTPIVSPAPILTDATIAAGPKTESKPHSFLNDHGEANTPLTWGMPTLFTFVSSRRHRKRNNRRRDVLFVVDLAGLCLILPQSRMNFESMNWIKVNQSGGSGPCPANHANQIFS